jgi:hypothetical protein
MSPLNAIGGPKVNSKPNYKRPSSIERDLSKKIPVICYDKQCLHKRRFIIATFKEKSAGNYKTN